MSQAYNLDRLFGIVQDAFALKLYRTPELAPFITDSGTVTAVAVVSDAEVLSDAPPTSTTTVTDGNLGNNATHESFTADIVYLESYTIATSAIVQSYQWQGKGDNSGSDEHWKFLIYLDNGSGVPGALLYASSEQTVSSVGSTVTTQTISPTALSIPAGTIWVGIHLHENHMAPTYTHGGSAVDAPDTYTDGPNDPFSGGGNTNDNLRDRLLTYIPNAANVALAIITGSGSLTDSAAAATVTTVAVLSGAEAILEQTATLTAVAVPSLSLEALADVGDDLPTGVLRLNNFESSAANGATISTANSGAGSSLETLAFDAVTTPVIYDTTHAHSGTKAAKFTTAGSAGSVQYRSLGNLNDGWVRFYVYLTAYPSAAGRVFNFISSAPATRSIIYIEPSGCVAMSNNAGTEVITGAVPVNLNGWTRIEAYIHGDASVGQVEFKVFLTPDSATPDEVQTSSANVNTGGTFDRAVFGPAGNANHAASWWVDDVGFSDQGYLGAYLAPYPVRGTAVTTGTEALADTGSDSALVVLDGSQQLTSSDVTDSGSLTATEADSALEALADAGSVTAVAVLSGADALADSSTITATESDSGVGSVAKIDSGLILAQAAPNGTGLVSSLSEAGVIIFVAVLSSAAQKLADAVNVTATAVISAADKVGDKGTVIALVALSLVEGVADGATTALAAIFAAFEALADRNTIIATANPGGAIQTLGDGETVLAVSVSTALDGLGDAATVTSTADFASSHYTTTAFTSITGSLKGYAYADASLLYNVQSIDPVIGKPTIRPR